MPRKPATTPRRRRPRKVIDVPPLTLEELETLERYRLDRGLSYRKFTAEIFRALNRPPTFSFTTLMETLTEGPREFQYIRTIYALRKFIEEHILREEFAATKRAPRATAEPRRRAAAR